MRTSLSLNDLNVSTDDSTERFLVFVSQQPTAAAASTDTGQLSYYVGSGRPSSGGREQASSVAAVEMSRSDYMPLYLGPVTVVGQRLGDRFEVKLTSFEFRCFGADLRPKTKPKMLKHFRPKTKMTKTIKNCHFRCRQRKRNSVGLYFPPHLKNVTTLEIQMIFFALSKLHDFSP